MDFVEMPIFLFNVKNAKKKQENNREHLKIMNSGPKGVYILMVNSKNLIDSVRYIEGKVSVT